MTTNNKTVDFRNPDQVVTLLRQRGAALAKAAKDESPKCCVKLADVADALAILMFVTAQGMEQQAQRVRPATRVSPIIRG